MQTWWTTLSGLNQVFYGIALFFSTLFAWQFVAALLGLSSGGVESAEIASGDAGSDFDHGVHDHGTATFRLLSVRSVIAFGMLFGWAGALYLQSGAQMSDALIDALVWGGVGMVIVAYFFYKIQQLTENDSPLLESCIGNTGEVYIDIPANGAGQIRVIESGAVNYVPAKGKDGLRIPHKTPVRVLRTLDTTTVEVEPIQT